MQSLKKFYFGKSKAKVNVFIGGVSAYINSPTVVVNNLLQNYPSGAVNVNRISKFSIIGANIQFSITGAYMLKSYSAFQQNQNTLTYYLDNDNLLKQIGNTENPAFWSQNTLHTLKIEGVINWVSGQDVFPNLRKILCLPNVLYYNSGSSHIGANKRYYIPRCTQLGFNTNTNNFLFPSGSTVYANPFLATCNAGAPDADLTAVISAGGTVRYVNNFNAPNPITNLTSGIITANSVQLIFTPTTGSTNALDFYDVYVNDIIRQDLNITASGQYVTGLPANTNFNIKLVVRDFFYNPSIFSNPINVTTSLF